MVLMVLLYGDPDPLTVIEGQPVEALEDRAVPGSCIGKVKLQRAVSLGAHHTGLQGKLLHSGGGNGPLHAKGAHAKIAPGVVAYSQEDAVIGHDVGPVPAGSYQRGMGQQSGAVHILTVGGFTLDDIGIVIGAGAAVAQLTAQIGAHGIDLIYLADHRMIDTTIHTGHIGNGGLVPLPGQDQ